MNTRLLAGFRTFGRLVGHLLWMSAIMACCIWIKPLEGDSRQIKSVVAFAVAIGLTAAYGAYHIGWVEGHCAGWRAGSDYKPNARNERLCDPAPKKFERKPETILPGHKYAPFHCWALKLGGNNEDHT